VAVSGQYREAATDLQHAVSLLREIYTTRLVPYQQSSSVFVYDEVDGSGVVAAVGSLIDTVALIGDELAERTQVARPSVTGQTNLSAANVTVVGRQPRGKRYSHADDLIQTRRRPVPGGTHLPSLQHHHPRHICCRGRFHFISRHTRHAKR